MTDFAELGIRVSSQEAEVAEDRLDGLATAAVRAEGAADNLGRSFQRVDAHSANMSRALASAGAQSKALQQAGLNMGRQFTDVGVQMAMGMNPFMIAIQQGPQIIDGFQMAAVQMGTTVRGAMAAMGTAIWTALAPLLPLIAAVSAAAAIGFGSFALATRAAGKEIGSLTEGMNLSEAQLKKLKEENVSTTTTMGDVWRGAGTTIKEGFFDLFGDQVAVIGRKWNEFLDWAWRAVVTSTKNITGAFVGAFYAIRDTWKMIPAAIGDATITAANLVVRGVENTINGAVRLLNGLIDKANAAAGVVGLRSILPRLSEANLADFANPFMGAMSRIGSQGAQSFGEGFQAGSGFVQRQADRLIENITASGQARIREAAGDASKAASGAGAAARRAASDADQLVERLRPLETPRIVPIEIELPRLADPLKALVEELQLLDGIARDAANGMSDAFGGVGRSIGDALAVLSNYRSVSAQIAMEAKEGRLSEAQAAREQANLQIRSYGDMASAAKGFFDEKSAGYRALQAVEMAYRAVQFANAVKAMVFEKAETGATVLQSGIKSAAHGVVAVARAIASMPFPLNIAAGAATAAALAAFGVKIFGGSRGGSAEAPALPETNTGTGSVLGDPAAQSESITRASEMAEKYWNRDLQYSNQMVDSLRAIESGIGSVTTAIARQVGLGGAFDTTKLGLGSSINPGFLGMFSSSRSSSLADQGLQFSMQRLSDILSNGIAGRSYQTVTNTKTKSGFFGIGGGTTTWNTETSQGIDGGLSQEIARLLGSLKDGVLSAASLLGLTGAEAVLDAFQVNIGRISFKGMSSSEIAETLTAVFSKVGDQMAASIAPGLAKFQQAGEGMMETLTRLAVQYQSVDAVMASMGKTFRTTGLASIEARDRLVQLSGGLEAFQDSAAFFVSEFLTEAQKVAPLQSAVAAEMARLGYASVDTREEFAALVMGIDVSTEAGAKLYAALMNVAPAFDQVADYAEKQAQKYRELAKGLRDFRLSLDDSALLGPASRYMASRNQFMSTSALAANADVDALGNLPDVSRSFLDASMAYSSSRVDYLRDVASVRASLAKAEAAAEGQVSEAQQQINLLDQTVTGIQAVNESVQQVVRAVEAREPRLPAKLARELYEAEGRHPMAFANGAAFDGGVVKQPTYFNRDVMGEAGSEAIMPLAQMPGGGLGVMAASDDGAASEVRAMRAEMAAMRAELNAALIAVATNTSRMDRRQQRWDGDGLYVRGPTPGDAVEVTGPDGDPVMTEAA